MVNFDSFTIVDGLGVLGFLTYATAELLLAFRKINSEQIFFYLIYALGAGLILTSLFWEFNTGAFLSEAFSLMICFLAIFVRLRFRANALRQAPSPPGAAATAFPPIPNLHGGHARVHPMAVLQAPTR